MILKIAKALVLIPAAFFGGLIVFCLFFGDGVQASSGRAPHVAESKKCDELRLAYHMTQEVIGAKTTGAEFPRDSTKTIWFYDDAGECGYVVTGSFIAQNALGGRVGAKFQSELSHAGGEWRLVSLKF